VNPRPLELVTARAPFRDRADAGRVLARSLARYRRTPDLVVLGLARGGVPVARAVVELCDPRARSAGESRLRYIWIVEAGLPRPEVNPLVVDALGTVVAMTDLLDTGAGLAGEYDGSTHRELEEHTSDNAREEDLEALGLVVVRATSINVGPKRLDLVRRLHVVLREGADHSRVMGLVPQPHALIANPRVVGYEA
jgi:hypothetical protein